MATTIASLHLFFVVGVAHFTKSRFWTWTAAATALFVAFAAGSGAYGLVDGICALIGLGIGLWLIQCKAPGGGNSRIHSAVPAPAPNLPARPTLQMAPAEMIELAPAPRRRRIGRWILAGTLLTAVCVWVAFAR